MQFCLYKPLCRFHVETAIGLAIGDAHIIRNAGQRLSIRLISNAPAFATVYTIIARIWHVYQKLSARFPLIQKRLFIKLDEVFIVDEVKFVTI